MKAAGFPVWTGSTTDIPRADGQHGITTEDGILLLPMRRFTDVAVFFVRRSAP